MQPGYWRKRVFKNTFTRGGKLICVHCWSVKIQHQGRRMTFSLGSARRAEAALEAHRLFQTIVSEGWDAALKNISPKARGDVAAAGKTGASVPIGTEAGYRQLRLVHREYSETVLPVRGRELSARIEHAGASHYFPLGTDDEAAAGRKAAEIGRVVTTQGWDAVNQNFRRELTAAFRWADNPVAWTYATFHTQPAAGRAHPRGNSTRGKNFFNVVIVESDAGVRQALAACVNRHDGFSCTAGFASAAEGLREIPLRRTHLTLVSHSLADQAGAAFLEDLRRLAPHATGLIYSLYEDSDQLFKSTPGGATGYLLKRTAPHSFLEPIAGTAESGGLSAERVASCARQYFQRLFAFWPASGPAYEMAKLTPREHDILALLSKGYVDKEIADSLRISIWTVHGHVKNVFEKLGVHTRTEAVVKYLQK